MASVVQKKNKTKKTKKKKKKKKKKPKLVPQVQCKVQALVATHHPSVTHKSSLTATQWEAADKVIKLAEQICIFTLTSPGWLLRGIPLSLGALQGLVR